MVVLLPRRAALAAVVVAGSLATLAALIVWHTADAPTAERTAPDVADPTPQPAPDPLPPPTAATSAAAENSASERPSALSVNDPESERALAAEVRSLVASGRIGKARALANRYYERFPRGPSAAELERLTGAHPRRDATDTRP
jgi:hypothetical protein